MPPRDPGFDAPSDTATDAATDAPSDAGLDPLCGLPIVIEAHGDIDSTQARMRARIAAGERVHGHVVRAERQVAGSGTRGRAWSSERGGSYQTLAVRDQPHGAGSRERSLVAPGVSVSVGIGIAEVLAERGAVVRVKWPNDLYLRDRKLGGILCEAQRGWLLVGVGVNVTNEPPPGGIALGGWDLSAVHDAVLEGVRLGLGLWVSGAPLTERFAAADGLADRTVTVRSGGREIRGRARGVTADGALRVDDEVLVDGTIASIDGRPTPSHG